jgi:hypothetical protein
MQAKRAFILLWLVSVALIVWSGFEPRYSIDDQRLPYPSMGVALLSLVTLGETALLYRVTLIRPRPLGLRVLLVLLGVGVLMIYGSVTAFHIPLFVTAHGLWLVLACVVAGLSFFKKS